MNQPMRNPLALAALVFLLTACGGGDGGGGAGTGTLSLKITDAPFPAIDGCLAAAIIVIDGVEAKGEEGFVDVPLADGAESLEIDLLDLRAGLADNLALGELASGTYSEIRLHVVEARMEFEDGAAAQPFKVPSGMSSGLKIKIRPAALVVAGQTTELMLDVDLTESFHTTGLGGAPTCDDLKAGESMVIFRPVIRAVNTDETGVITGVVQDDAGSPAVDVEICAFDAGTVVDETSIPVATTFSSPALEGIEAGSYALFLEEGSYDLYVRAQGVETKTLAASGVIVTKGEIAAGNDLTLPAAP